jgi:hypothetical protein
MKHLSTYEGLFDFFKKKKPTESPKVDVLYEPIEVPYMVEYEDNHKTIPFTKSESDYLMGLVKDPSDVVYNSGHKFSANHYRVKINHKEFIIRKYDDEWFFVTIHYSKIKDINWRDKYKYYKCDTFDGVKQLLYES